MDKFDRARKSMEPKLRDHIKQRDRITELEAEVQQLRSALEKYGRHTSECRKLLNNQGEILAYAAIRDDRECTCGLEQVKEGGSSGT